jgi:hypothetical protein
VADRVRLPVASPVTSAFPKSPLGRLHHKSAQRLQSGLVLRGCSHSMIFRPPSLLATQIVPTAGLHCGCQGGRGVYIRAERGSLPNRASDMLAVRIGQLTAEVLHLLDLQRCWLLRTFTSWTSLSGFTDSSRILLSRAFPSATVLKFTTNSNLVGASIGVSAGSEPVRSLAANTPCWLDKG